MTTGTPARLSGTAWRYAGTTLPFGIIRGGSGADPRASASRTRWLVILPVLGHFTVGFTAMSTHFRVTYATLSADNEELHAAYEAGLLLARSWLGADISGYVSGEPRGGGALFTVTSPGDLSLTLCRVHP